MADIEKNPLLNPFSNKKLFTRVLVPCDKLSTDNILHEFWLVTEKHENILPVSQVFTKNMKLFSLRNFKY